VYCCIGSTLNSIQLNMSIYLAISIHSNVNHTITSSQKYAGALKLWPLGSHRVSWGHTDLPWGCTPAAVMATSNHFHLFIYPLPGERPVLYTVLILHMGKLRPGAVLSTKPIGLERPAGEVRKCLAHGRAAGSAQR
jgi:hypothetical protein